MKIEESFVVFFFFFGFFRKTTQRFTVLCLYKNVVVHLVTAWCYGYDNSKKESVAARDKSGEPPPQERFQADEGGAAEEVHTDTGEVPRSLTVTDVEGHTDEAEILQVLGKGLVGETSGSSRDFVVDENANSYLVKEESQTLGADRGLVEGMDFWVKAGLFLEEVVGAAVMVSSFKALAQQREKTKTTNQSKPVFLRSLTPSKTESIIPEMLSRFAPTPFLDFPICLSLSRTLVGANHTSARFCSR
ncbi:hypothetical protein ACOSQ2_029467 [Xanthoceras sorbifolium]